MIRQENETRSLCLKFVANYKQKTDRDKRSTGRNMSIKINSAIIRNYFYKANFAG